MRKRDWHDTTDTADTADTADTNADESWDPPSIEKDRNEIDLGAKLTRDLFSIRLERLLVWLRLLATSKKGLKQKCLRDLNCEIVAS